jgi:hypothetical protein
VSDGVYRSVEAREGDCFVSLHLGVVVLVRWCLSGACVVRDCEGVLWILDRSFVQECGVRIPAATLSRGARSPDRRGV